MNKHNGLNEHNIVILASVVNRDSIQRDEIQADFAISKSRGIENSLRVFRSSR